MKRLFFALRGCGDLDWLLLGRREWERAASLLLPASLWNCAERHGVFDRV